MAGKQQSRFWLMKTEPDTFSFDDLVKARQSTTSWEGVRNYQARNFMRDDFRIGDQVLIYHSSVAVPGVVGTATVVREAHPDLTALDPRSPYFDEKSASDGVSRWCMVDVQAVTRFAEVVTLEKIRGVPELANMLVIKRGMRLSIQPVTAAEWKMICKLGGSKALG